MAAVLSLSAVPLLIVVHSSGPPSRGELGGERSADSVDLSARTGSVYRTHQSNLRKVTADSIGFLPAAVPLLTELADDASSEVRFSYPEGMAVDGNGNAYVADLVNNPVPQGQ